MKDVNDKKFEGLKILIKQKMSSQPGSTESLRLLSSINYMCCKTGIEFCAHNMSRLGHSRYDDHVLKNIPGLLIRCEYLWYCDLLDMGYEDDDITLSDFNL